MTMTMTRQDALDVAWKRLLFVLVILVVLCVTIAVFAGDFRTSILILLSGNIGGYVAVHRSLGQLTDNEVVQLSNSWFGIIVPSFVGGILAFVLYLLFLSELVAGEMFPKFEPNPEAAKGFESLFEQHGESMVDYAKVFFWSFIAGFNQKYVVDVINSVRSKT